MGETRSKALIPDEIPGNRCVPAGYEMISGVFICILDLFIEYEPPFPREVFYLRLVYRTGITNLNELKPVKAEDAMKKLWVCLRAGLSLLLAGQLALPDPRLKRALRVWIEEERVNGYGHAPA